MTAPLGGRSAWAAGPEGAGLGLWWKSPGDGAEAAGALGYMLHCRSIHGKSDSGQLPLGMWRQQLERMTHLDCSQDLHLSIYEVAVPDREVW